MQTKMNLTEQTKSKLYLELQKLKRVLEIIQNADLETDMKLRVIYMVKKELSDLEGYINSL